MDIRQSIARAEMATEKKQAMLEELSASVSAANSSNPTKVCSCKHKKLSWIIVT